MLPDAHPQTVSDIGIKTFAKAFHHSDFEVVYPSTDRYFTHMIHDDMDAIAKGIRAAHTKDFDTAPDTSVADTIREGIEEAAKFKGSAKETQVFLMCHTLGLDYKSLSPEEFAVLVKTLGRSKKMKMATNQRGRKGKHR